MYQSLPQGPVRFADLDPQPPSPPGLWDRTTEVRTVQIPQRLKRPAHRRPFSMCVLSREVALRERRHRCGEQRARRCGSARLHYDGDLINAVGLEVADRHAPRRRCALPVAELVPAEDYTVISV